MAIAFTRTFGSVDNVGVSPPQAGVQLTFYRVIDVTTIAVATNLVTLGYLPRGAICTGGYFACVDMDTGTETLDMDLGIAANTDQPGGVDVADPDFFMNGGLFSGDAITDLPFTNSANFRPLLGPFPVLQLSAKTLVQLITNTAANATGTGKFVVCINYILPGVSTS